MDFLASVGGEYRLGERDAIVRACTSAEDGRGYRLRWQTIDDGPSLSEETGSAIFAERAVPLINLRSSLTLGVNETNLPEIMAKGWFTIFAVGGEGLSGHAATLHYVTVQIEGAEQTTLPISGETAKAMGHYFGRLHKE